MDRRTDEVKEKRKRLEYLCELVDDKECRKIRMGSRRQTEGEEWMK